MENLDLIKQEPKHLSLNRLVLTLVFVIIALVVLGFLVFTPMQLIHFGFINLGLWSFYILLYFYIGAAYRHFSYAMNDHGLYINRGVFWRRKIVVPRNRVQHTDVTQGPLERKYELSELIVHTAGTRNASVRLPGIFFKDAEVLRESLSFEESDDV
jgi:membrane protein YdbS with pleckstrin-like domain